MRAALLGLLICLPLPGIAQELSEAERAADSQRGLTEAERALRRDGCAFVNGPGGDEITVAPGIAGPVHDFPPMQLMELVRLAYDGPAKDTFTIAEFTALPYGGIGGRDFCGVVSVDFGAVPVAEGDVKSMMGLLLRDGLDVAADYPATWVEIDERGQLATFEGGRFVALDKSAPAVRDWYEANGPAWLETTAPGLAIVTQDKVFLPVPDA